MCRILVVDDDPQARIALATLIDRYGLGHTSQAGDGREGLASLAAFPADLIITDCQMPNMDGISFVRTLRSMGYVVPVIMLSAQGDPRIIQLALSAGVDRYIEKPINPPLLLETIRRASSHHTFQAA